MKYLSYVEANSFKTAVIKYNLDISSTCESDRYSNFLTVLRCFYDLLVKLFISYETNKICKDASHFKDIFQQILKEYISLSHDSSVNNSNSVMSNYNSLIRTYLPLIKFKIQQMYLYQNQFLINHQITLFR